MGFLLYFLKRTHGFADEWKGIRVRRYRVYSAMALEFRDAYVHFLKRAADTSMYPQSSKLIKPLSKSASMWAASNKPLFLSRRSLLLLDFQSLM